jgi:pullulanase/glycogen debranching enzyme
VRLSAGAPHPLGATWDGRGTNFALFSANEQKVELCLFDSRGRREIERIALPERLQGQAERAGSIRRVPAADIEALVIRSVRRSSVTKAKCP